MWTWLKRRRRARILSEPLPPSWREALDRGVALWRLFTDAERARLEDDLRVFLAERSWEPCGGLDLTEEMKAVIGAQACILTLGRSVDAFDHIRTILVYPDRFFAPDTEEDEFGVVTEDYDDREGEAWERGQVILSWADVRQDAKRLDGRNLVLHEFAHQIDLMDFLAATRPSPRKKKSGTTAGESS
jgi:MtfA peptidase